MTEQAKNYNEYMFSYQRNGYRPETLVDRDGGTVKYFNTVTKDVTYSVSKAYDWYINGTMIYVSRDCAQTVIAILNSTRSIRRKLAGNGKVEYYSFKKGDVWHF